MARARCLPTRFFKDPDVDAAGNDGCLILVGLVLDADDYGRGYAHSGLLGREIRGYAPEQVENVLHILEALELLTLYTVGKHRYYCLPRWNEWQTLSHPTPSKFPAPPAVQQISASAVLVHAHRSDPAAPVQQIGSDSAATCSETAAQVKLSESNSSESKVIQEKVGEEEATPPFVLVFPTTHSSDTTASLVQEDANTETQRPVALLMAGSATHGQGGPNYCYDHTLSVGQESTNPCPGVVFVPLVGPFAPPIPPFFSGVFGETFSFPKFPQISQNFLGEFGKTSPEVEEEVEEEVELEEEKKKKKKPKGKGRQKRGGGDGVSSLSKKCEKLYDELCIRKTPQKTTSPLWERKTYQFTSLAQIVIVARLRTGRVSGNAEREGAI